MIPSDPKWFRAPAIAKIIVETMEKPAIDVPLPTVNIDEIRRKYHKTEKEG